MAGQIINWGNGRMAIDYHDGEGSAIVNGRLWRWEFHEYCGPTFLRKDGEARKHIPKENHPVWDAFEKWLKKYRPKRKKAKAHEIIKLDIK